MHSLDLPVFFHDQSFLPSFDGDSAPPSSASSHHPSVSRANSSAASIPSLGEHPAFSPAASFLTQSPASTPGLGSGGAHYFGNPDAEHHGSHTSLSKFHHHHHHHGKHTFNAGLHQFPFSFHIPGSLPASIKVGTGSCLLSYQLKAVALKSGFGVFGGKWSVKKTITIVRGLVPDSSEYNQTLEIENTWPGKVMYSLTLPHKAYCAGDKISVSVLCPLLRSVRRADLIGAD